ncbi:MAG: glycogen synthase GlgA [Candidatus Omnitrophica bacterium]|nr:glycogen synthase GlgA [Candidatus Omnitrophota bacterium]
MKIVFCASEVVPFAKTGGLADVCGSLPLALEYLGHEVIVITPRYASSGSKVPTPVVRIGRNIEVHFIEHKHYFGREGLYGDINGDYKDNLERFSFFCHQSLKVLKEINFKPDIVHCHDWHTALIPVLLKTKYEGDPFFKNTKSVLTIHNLAYQGVFPKDQYSTLGVEGRLFHTQGLEFYNQINILKGGLIFSDAITTVSPRYSQEMQTVEMGCALDGVLRNRSEDIYGILNGLDYEAWNPHDDPFLFAPFSTHNLDNKDRNKAILQEEFKIDVDPARPLFGFVARLCHQKGVGLIIDALADIIRMGGQIVLTGTGDRKYHWMLEEAVKEYPKHIGIYLKFEERVAHQIYAGSDFFLMPSVYEPCGLGQMIALRYGSIPIVYKTGGLADTISLYDSIHQTGNGFLFTEYTKSAFVKAIVAAVKAYNDPQQKSFLLTNAMKYRFSWEKSAKDYVRVYHKCLS